MLTENQVEAYHRDGYVKVESLFTDEEVEEESEIRIRVGYLGNLAESQVIYARIRDAL